jgi:regulator of replication initiation timing
MKLIEDIRKVLRSRDSLYQEIVSLEKENQRLQVEVHKLKEAFAEVTTVLCYVRDVTTTAASRNV